MIAAVRLFCRAGSLLSQSDQSLDERYINGAADRCVKCGLCLPHCPTYQLALLESESPRGRIALMQGLANNQLPVSVGLTRHLDQCLGCRACETVCPAGVPYGRLLDKSRALLRERRVKPGLTWRIFALTVQRKWLIRLGGLLMQLLGQLRRVSGGWLDRQSRLFRLIPSQVSVKRLAEFYPAATGPAQQGTVRLFCGCLGETLEQDTLISAIRILNKLGFDVRVPPNQGCCGAVHQHAGYPEKAAQLATNNIRAFRGDDAILVVATGCLASLCEYREIVQDGDQQSDAGQFAGRCIDINEFLNLHLKPAQAGGQSAGAAKVVALHTPCSRKVVPGNADAALDLLTRQQGIEYRRLGDGQCCGAAGAYLVDQPVISQALGESFQLDVAPLILTSNIGCRLQIEAMCRQQGICAKVAHPVTLLANDERFLQFTVNADI